MRLSTRTLYGLRLMFQLGAHFDNPGPLQLREICAREQISEKYMSAIIMLLKAQGLVHSVRGAQGGYRLAEAPGKISLYDVVECLEGEMLPVPETEGVCLDDSQCAVNEVWGKLQKGVRQILDDMTLEDVLVSHQKFTKVGDYSI